jgi:hypothetical protein
VAEALAELNRLDGHHRAGRIDERHRLVSGAIP